VQSLYWQKVGGKIKLLARTRTSDGSVQFVTPRPSPDGSQILFVRWNLATSQLTLYRVGTSGHGLRKVIEGGFQAAWAPNGKQIAFVLRPRGGGDADIYVANPDGSHRRRLTTAPGDDLAPDWSPDGRWIVFTSKRSGHFELFRIRPDGTSETRLTDNPAGAQMPAWSPDGRQIVFASRRSGAFDLFVINADGSNESQLTSGPGDKLDPAWRPLPRRRRVGA
jgi:Tol biopolymer transport system component